MILLRVKTTGICPMLAFYPKLFSRMIKYSQNNKIKPKRKGDVVETYKWFYRYGACVLP
jgi:hypothetical protein